MTSTTGGGGTQWFIGAIDQGTSSSRFLLFDESCQLRAKHQQEIRHIMPHDGWLEQDPMELVKSVRVCMEEVMERGKETGIVTEAVKGIGITNQRETTILWDKDTGECFYNAVDSVDSTGGVWCDNRTQQLSEQLIAQTPNKSQDYLKPKCGLPIHPYFSALKIRWLMDNVPAVATAMEERRCLFGTVDTWIIWNLTGGVNGGVHITDITNACRTMLMNIHTCQWDVELCSFFNIPMHILPEIRSSSELYGRVNSGPLLGVHICGCLGDQQAALVGQRCLSQGDAKNTYGTGCFLLYNTGKQPVLSNRGLLTTVAYQLGPDQPVYYALEGSVAIAGQSVRWLRDNLQFFPSASDIENLAQEVENTADVYFVPAFSGLFAPYWQPDARGLVIGLTNFTNKAHLCRATLEAVCFQSRELLEAMNQDSELPLASLKVDGGMTENKLLLQLQADLLGIPVECPEMSETTVLGAALAAGRAVGVWAQPSLLPAPPTSTFTPSIGHDERDTRYSRWKEAVKRCMHWHVSGTKINTENRALWAFPVGVVTGAVLLAGLLLAMKGFQ